MKNVALKKKILSISYKYGLSHLGSCLTAVDLIADIYSIKKENEPFINSSAHNSLALYVVLEDKYGIDAEMLWKKHGTHCNRDMDNKIWFSGGSLGMGLSASLGFALADRTKDCYVLISDGECAEGVVWETIKNAADQKLENLKICVNANGYSALGKVDLDRLQWKLGSFIENNCPKIAFMRTNYDDFLFLKGVSAHYLKLTEETYKQAMEICEKV